MARTWKTSRSTAPPPSRSGRTTSSSPAPRDNAWPSPGPSGAGSRLASWISPRGGSRRLSLSLAILTFLLPVVLWAASTFPPATETRLPARDALDASKVALLSGRPEQAYRLLLLAQPSLGDDAEWLEAAAKVYLALDRQGLEAGAYLRLATHQPAAAARAKAILERT